MMLSHVKLMLPCLVGTLLSAGAAMAQTSGFTFAVEGGFGYRLAEPMTPFSYQPLPTSNLDGPGPDWLTPDLANRIPLTGRVEMMGTAAGPGGWFLRAGAVAAGWLGFNQLQRDAWGGEAAIFEGVGDDQHRVTHAQICKPGADQPACVPVEGRLLETYHEIVPGLFIGSGFGRGGYFGLGAQAFAGWLTERGYSGVTFGGTSTTAFADRVDGRALGALGTAELNVPIGQRTQLILTGGAGAYLIAASSMISQFTLTDGEVTSQRPDTPQSADIHGFRFQGAVGISRQIGDRIELGLMTRSDFWTAFPRMEWIYVNPAVCESKSDGDHAVTHCQAGKPEGVHGLTIDPLFTTAVGLRLTVHFGD